MAGVRAFREAYANADLHDSRVYESLEARQTRYAIYWGFFESTAYRDVHTWATSYRTDYALYKYIRNIYNPAYRIGAFWRSYLWGGLLDPSAGPGDPVASALPIIVPDSNPMEQQLRLAISQLWEWSNWQARKDIVTLQGAILGDAVLMVNDDRERGKVYLDTIYPGSLIDAEVDAYGNVKAYEIQERRDDPTRPGQVARYRETAERGVGDEVIYCTYLNDAPYAWNGVAAEWSEPYGFIPMVLIQHNNVGLDWGWSEIHPALSKIREADDQASLIDDQIRKVINPVWLMKGMAAPGSKGQSAVEISGTAATATDTAPGREELPALWTTNDAADAKPMLAAIDIQAATANLAAIVAEIERDFPELKFESLRTQGQVSGETLRVGRQPAEIKVKGYRPNYDNPLVRAQQMAVAIGGLRGYRGFQGFDLSSYAQGHLDHHIGDRPVFARDRMEELGEDQSFWTAAKTAKEAGLPLDVFLGNQGWDEGQIQALYDSPDYQARLALIGLGLGTDNG